MTKVNKACLEVSMAWIVISVLPFFVWGWGEVGFYSWAMLNRFTGELVEKYISSNNFVFVFLTTIVNASILFLVVKFLGEFLTRVFKRRGRRKKALRNSKIA